MLIQILTNNITQFLNMMQLLKISHVYIHKEQEGTNPYLEFFINNQYLSS